MAYKYRYLVFTCKTLWRSLWQFDETRGKLKQVLQQQFDEAAHWFSFTIISLKCATNDPFLRVNLKSAI